MKRFFSILLALFALPAFAWEGEGYISSNYNVSSGLSADHVNAIHSDREGFLWIGTNNGLDRYDGYSFTHIPLVEKGSPTYIYDLCEDLQGDIWVCAASGIYRYDKKKGSISVIRMGMDDGLYARQIACDREGALWAVTSRRRLVRIDPGNNSVEGCAMQATAVTASEDALYVLSGNSLLVLRDGLQQWETIAGGAGILSGKDVKSIKAVSDWIFIEVPDGNLMLNPENGTVRELEWPYIKDVICSSEREIWVSGRSGIHILDSQLRELRSVHIEGLDFESLQDIPSRVLCMDRCGGIWIGTYFYGLYHLARNYTAFRHHYPGGRTGPRTKVREFVENADGKVFVGTDFKGLWRYDPQKDSLIRVPLPIRSRNILGLYREGETLWIGSASSSDPLLMMDCRTLEARPVPGAGPNIYAILRDRSGRLWMGSDKAVFYGHCNRGAFYKEMEQPTNQVCRIIEGRDGKIWIATTTTVWCYDASEMQRYPFNISNVLTDIYEDSHGRIWVTSDYDGLFQYIPETDSFVRHSLGDLPESFTLYRIAEDSAGKLWMTTFQGLLSFDPEADAVAFFGKKEGLVTGNFNYASNYLASDGRLYAGTAEGFISLHPGKFTDSEKPAPRIVFSEIVLKNALNGTDKAEYLQRRAGQPVRIPHAHNSFSVKVSDLDYVMPKTTHMVYRLNGFSSTWYPVIGNSIDVTSLPTGKYRLEVQIEEYDGSLLSGEGGELDIIIKVPKVLSAPAILGYSLLFVLLVFGISRLIAGRERKRMEQRMTVEAELLKAENEKKLYASKIEFLSGVAHEIRTPLSLVKLPVRDILERLGKSSDRTVTKDLEIVSRNADALSILIDELLDFSKLDSNSYQPRIFQCDLCALLQNACDRFSLSIRDVGKSFDVDIPEVPCITRTDPSFLDKIFNNLLSNAMRYSHREISVKMSFGPGNAVISVTNDGAIVPADSRESIFTPFFRYESGYSQATGTGLGLSTSRQFASMIGGTLAMDDDLSVNRFVLTLPLDFAAVEAEGPLHGPLPLHIQENSPMMMIVEDNPDYLAFLTSQFEKDFNIVTAGNGKEALDLLSTGRLPAVIISDVMMPQMDGYQFCRAVKSDIGTCHIPVVLLTAWADENAQVQGLEYGADIYFGKTVPMDLLGRQVRNLLLNRSRIHEHFSKHPVADPVDLDANAPDTRFLLSVQKYILDHISEGNILVDAIASAVYVSPSLLFKKMKVLTGLSPIDYVRLIRLKKARELLSDSRLSIADVREATGWNSPSYFSAQFKKMFGKTPREYREED